MSMKTIARAVLGGKRILRIPLLRELSLSVLETEMKCEIQEAARERAIRGEVSGKVRELPTDKLG